MHNTCASYGYQYHIKDHLGNIRVTFTTKPQVTTTYSTNFEGATAADFQNYSNTTFDLVDHTDPAGTTSQKVQLLNGGANGRVGLAKSIPVMIGDEITASAYVKYMNLGTSPNTNPLLTNLASVFGVSSSSTGDQLNLYNGLNSYAGSVPAGDHTADDEGAPKLFVTILFFDKNYNFVDAAWDQVSTVGAQTSPSVKQPPHDLITKTVKSPVAGYAYIFFSNEHYNYVDAYFDDASIAFTPSPIIATDDYYPFGLAFNSFNRENNLLNQFEYNGKETQDELNLGWMDYGARMYMPEIGRWGVIDPLAHKFEIVTPYNYAFNNPVLFVDPDGRENMIYLIIAGNFSYNELKKIEGMINKMFETLNLETRALAFNEKEKGAFQEDCTDATDTWAVIGTDRKEIAEKAKSISGDENYDKTVDGWVDDSGTPEVSNKRGGKGIVIDYNTNLSEADGGLWAKRNRAEEAGLATIHGAGHSSNLIQNTKSYEANEFGHLDLGVMQAGPFLAADYRQGGLDRVLCGGFSNYDGLKGNEVYVQGMMERYGTKRAHDNYENNKKK
jgi:RHS repeat-associated protein